MPKHDNSHTYVWLSHELNAHTPAYGGGQGFQFSTERSMTDGHHCNASSVAFSSHLGTHVDVPYHFIRDGKKVSDYQPEQWVFTQCGVIELLAQPDEIIDADKIKPHADGLADVDLLLIKTGFERYRGQSTYWQHSPAYCGSIARYIKQTFPSIAAIGFDSISLTGFQHRELGRQAHRDFLSLDIRIFEDMHLQQISRLSSIQQVTALPLRYDQADGAPCTLLAALKVG